MFLNLLEWSVEFQSAPPAWGATIDAAYLLGTRMFQSAPPAWGATPCNLRMVTQAEFQSAPPAWGATNNRGLADGMDIYVSIRAPRVGGDAKRWTIPRV